MLVLLTCKRRRIELITKCDLQMFIESEKIVRKIVCCSNIVSDIFTKIKIYERDNSGSVFRKNRVFVYFCIAN